MASHHESLETVLSDFETHESGLDSDEAQQRLDRHGPNELPEAGQRSALLVFVSQFTSALILVLVAAAGLSVWAGHVVDAVLIGVIIVANGVLGFVQEYPGKEMLSPPMLGCSYRPTSKSTSRP